VAASCFSIRVVYVAETDNLVVTLAKACDPHWQVKEHIFTDSNKLTKSKQVMLNTLNELRMCYVLERSIFSGQTKREKVRVLIS